MYTWTPKVCRVIAFYRFWAIIFPTFGRLCLQAELEHEPTVAPETLNSKPYLDPFDIWPVDYVRAWGCSCFGFRVYIGFRVWGLPA